VAVVRDGRVTITERKYHLIAGGFHSNVEILCQHSDVVVSRVDQMNSQKDPRVIGIQQELSVCCQRQIIRGCLALTYLSRADASSHGYVL